MNHIQLLGEKEKGFSVAFERSEIPPRSKLYSLMPCGLGTGFTESLTSYLNRLAGLHHVSPRHLAAQEIVPRLRQTYSSQPFSGFCWSAAMGLNGNGPQAREWATILEDLTHVSDLHLLTLGPWVGDLQPLKLQRTKPAWCPACYAEWQEKDLPLYEPLIWTFQVVSICIKHERKLEEHCPVCERRQSVLRRSAALGHCAHCQTWLGSVSPAAESLDPETLLWQRWVWQALGELRRTTLSSSEHTFESFFEYLSASVRAFGKQSRLAEIAGLARGQFALWLRRSHTPTLQSILEFCYACNVTPLQVLSGDLAPLKQVIEEGKPYRSPRPRRSFRSVDREQCLERIQAILDGREEPLGYVQLAQQLGYSGNTLLYHFPQECAELSKQIKAYRQQRKERRFAQVQEEMRQAVLALHTQGVYPSQNKVGDLLSDPNVLFQSEVKATWRALCRELGWDRGKNSLL